MKLKVLALLGLLVSSAVQAKDYIIGDSIGNGVKSANLITGNARNGTTTSYWLSHLALPSKIDTLYIFLGTNDSPTKQYENILHQFVQKILTYHPRSIVWVSPPCIIGRPVLQEQLHGVEDIQQKVIENYPITYLSISQMWCAGINRTADGVHFTYEGYKQLYKVVK